MTRKIIFDKNIGKNDILRENHNHYRVFYISIVFCFFVTIISHFLMQYFESINTYYVSYICWLILIFALFAQKQVINDKAIIFIFVFAIFRFISVIVGEIVYLDGFSGIIREMFLIIGFATCFCFKPKKKINEKEILLIFKSLVFIGLVSCLFAIVTQFPYLIAILKRQNVSSNSWKYVSFFKQRNIYAGMCYLSSVAALVTYGFTKEKKYIFFIFLFIFQIYITNSRDSLLAVLILCFVYIIQWNKNRWIKTTGLILLIITIFFSLGGVDFIVSNFAHKTASGVDSGESRFKMWQGAIYEIISKKIWVFGAGGDSLGNYVMTNYGVGSFHNMYIDILFIGGIPLISIYIYTIIESFKNIKHDLNQQYRKIMVAGLLSFCFYSMFEAGLTLFSSTYLAIMSSVIFILLPRCRVHKK